MYYEYGPILQAILDGEMDYIFGEERCESFRKKFKLFQEKMDAAELFVNDEQFGPYISIEEKKDYLEREKEKYLPNF